MSDRGLKLGLELKARARKRSRGLTTVRALAQQFRDLPRYDGRAAFDLLVAWTKARLKFANVKRCVIGVSGGVDSALAACVLKKACPRGTTAFLIPVGGHMDPDGEKLCRALKLPFQTLNLSIAYDALVDTLTPASGTANGNLKTRLRTLALFHEAAAHNALFVGTGDLDEGYVGYYTKGSGADLAPIGSLHKSEVRKLLALALKPFDATLARRLSKKPADAGLVENQTAEQELGVRYDEIERALTVIFQSCVVFEGGVVPRELDVFAAAFEQSGLSEKTFGKVVDLIHRARHKSAGAPVLWRADIDWSGTAEFESE